jgi:hypothetical protein
MLSEFLMTTRRTQYATWVELDRRGYVTRCGDSNSGPSVIVEHPDAESRGVWSIVQTIDQLAKRY